MGDDGRPQPVQQTLIAPPEGRIGPISDDERTAVMQRAPIRGRYDASLDRQSAYEMLKQRAETAQTAETQRLKELEAEKKSASDAAAPVLRRTPAPDRRRSHDQECRTLNRQHDRQADHPGRFGFHFRQTLTVGIKSEASPKWDAIIRSLWREPIGCKRMLSM